MKKKKVIKPVKSTKKKTPQKTSKKPFADSNILSFRSATNTTKPVRRKVTNSWNPSRMGSRSDGK